MVLNGTRFRSVETFISAINRNYFMDGFSDGMKFIDQLSGTKSLRKPQGAFLDLSNIGICKL